MHEDSTVMQYAPIEDFQVHDTKVYNTFPRCDTGALRNQDPQMGSYGSETRPILVSQAVPMPAAHFPTAQYGFSPGMLEDWPWAHELRKVGFEEPQVLNLSVLITSLAPGRRTQRHQT